jgi:regulator of sigma E protease
LQSGLLEGTEKNTFTALSHLLGMPGVFSIAEVGAAAQGKGIEPGDVVVRVGNVEFPSMAEGIREIRARKGKTVALSVLRKDPSGAYTRIDLPEVAVARNGQVGVSVRDSSMELSIVAAPLATLTNTKFEKVTPSAAGSAITAGSRIIAVDDAPISTLRDASLAVREAVGRGATSVTLTIKRPVAGDVLAQGPDERVTLNLTEQDIAELKGLGWSADFSSLAFGTQQQVMKASNPAEALAFGFYETKRVMGMTYLTFARLAQGTVKVEHLKGPVGIAHLGTLVADRGFIWLLFFLALISVNLAVINFLPLPIVDGGQFLFLLYEAIRGRPVPVQIQNGVTMVGLVLIAGMFLLVTFNDVRNLLGL